MKLSIDIVMHNLGNTC